MLFPILGSLIFILISFFLLKLIDLQLHSKVSPMVCAIVIVTQRHSIKSTIDNSLMILQIELLTMNP